MKNLKGILQVHMVTIFDTTGILWAGCSLSSLCLHRMHACTLASLSLQAAVEGGQTYDGLFVMTGSCACRLLRLAPTDKASIRQTDVARPRNEKKHVRKLLANNNLCA